MVEKRKETKYGAKIVDKDKPVIVLTYDDINVGDEIPPFTKYWTADMAIKHGNIYGDFYSGHVSKESARKQFGVAKTAVQGAFVPPHSVSMPTASMTQPLLLTFRSAPKTKRMRKLGVRKDSDRLTETSCQSAEPPQPHLPCMAPAPGGTQSPVQPSMIPLYPGEGDTSCHEAPPSAEI